MPDRRSTRRSTALDAEFQARSVCGTKVLRKRDYEKIANNRRYFGDFDLIFGASKLNLKTAEVPIRCAARAYGETNISRFRHG